METNGTCLNELTEEQKLMGHHISLIFECVLTLLISPFGILFNGIALYLLSTTKLFESFFNRLLAFMATFDILYLIVSISEAVRQHLVKSCLHDYIFVVLVYPLRSILMCCSIYTTLALALERYFKVCKPLSKMSIRRRGIQANKWKRVVKYILPIVVFATLLYTPKFLELKTVDCKKQCYTMNSNNEANCTEKRVEITQLRNDENYVLWYVNVSRFLFDWALPITSLAYLNIRIYLTLKQYLHRRHIRNRSQATERPKDVHQAIVLFSIVFLLFMCHLPRVILNIQEFINLLEKKYRPDIYCKPIQYWTRIIYPISNFLLKFNASVNFFIYVAFDQNFRNMIKLKFPSVFKVTEIQSTMK